MSRPLVDVGDQSPLERPDEAKNKVAA